MSSEKPKNPHLKIEHIKDKFDNSSDKNENVLPQEITPDFLKSIEMSDPQDEIEKKRLLKMLQGETDIEKIKQIEFALRQLLLS